jgi:DNA-binding transcriptional MocR family regulator
MKVVEIPTHPQDGMDLDELQRAIRKHRIKACITMTTCHNPLGFVMRDERKKALVDLASRAGIILIEDDVYADLAFEGPRPRTAKSFDKGESVILCSSFSKILAPGYRVGWVAGGRFRAEIERLQLLTTMAAPSLPQLVIAEFLELGGYDRHLKRLRATLALQVETVRQAAAKYLPEGTRISHPAGGYVLWVQLPRGLDALQLYHTALAERISILPGPIFSPTGRYKNYMRISCGHRWSEAHDRALLTLGRLCDRALAKGSGKIR